MDWDWTVPYVCPVCGGSFYVTCRKDWAYKRNTPANGKTNGETKFFCTWSCMRKYDSQIEERRKK